jgi:hypothetical protein
MGSYNVGVVMRGGYGQVGAEITRPENDTQYAALDAVADASQSATTHRFANAARKVGGSGGIVNARVVTNNLDWTNALTLVVYDTPPATFVADNTAFDEKWVDRDSIVTEITFPAMTTFTGAAGSFRRAVASGLNEDFTCADDSKDLYFQAVLPSGTPTPTEEQKFGFRLGLLRD